MKHFCWQLDWRLSAFIISNYFLSWQRDSHLPKKRPFVSITSMGLSKSWRVWRKWRICNPVLRGSTTKIYLLFTHLICLNLYLINLTSLCEFGVPYPFVSANLFQHLPMPKAAFLSRLIIYSIPENISVSFPPLIP